MSNSSTFQPQSFGGSINGVRLSIETGSVLILSIFVIVIVLAVGGLAVDAGNLYRARLHYQKAADAGALAGFGFHILNGRPSNPNPKANIETRAKQIAEANLTRAGFTLQPGAVTAIFTPATPPNTVVDSITVNISNPVNLLLFHLVPFEFLDSSSFGRMQTVDASATSELGPASVVLMLDKSGSMNCPATAGLTPEDCPCVSLGTCNLSVSKTNSLVTALNSTGGFFDQLDPNRDEVALISFATAANVLADFIPHRFDKPLLKNRVANELIPRGNTNISDALMRGIEAAQSPTNAFGNREIAFVLFTDGAPTASRYFFGNAKTSLAKTNSNPDQWDYINYEVMWPGNGTNGTAPSKLIASNNVPDDYDSPQIPGGSTHCDASVLTYNDGSALDNCLNDFGLRMPVKNGIFAGGVQFTQWREQFYHNAIIVSDIIRENRGTIYAIGLGPPASVAEIPADPYQRIEDTFSRKDRFLRRLTLDLLSVSDPEFVCLSSAPDSQNNCAHPANIKTSQRGIYLSTTTPNDLKQLFVRIAQKILLRLIR